MTESSELEQLRTEHTPEAVSARLRAGPKQSYLRDFVYGAIDGTVTTFAVVAGVAGAELSDQVIIILGLANLIADGFSMASSNWSALRAEEQLRQKARAQEEMHVERHPEGEREEIRQIFAEKGFQGEDLERVVEVITANRERWVNVMLQEELGLTLKGPSAIWAALTTFVAFIVIGSIPLLTFLLRAINPDLVTAPFLWSCILTGLTFFGVGVGKSYFVKQRWYWSGLETLFVGGLAASLAYGIGALLKGVVGVS